MAAVPARYRCIAGRVARVAALAPAPSAAADPEALGLAQLLARVEVGIYYGSDLDGLTTAAVLAAAWPTAAHAPPRWLDAAGGHHETTAAPAGHPMAAGAGSDGGMTRGADAATKRAPNVTSAQALWVCGTAAAPAAATRLASAATDAAGGISEASEADVSDVARVVGVPGVHRVSGVARVAGRPGMPGVPGRLGVPGVPGVSGVAASACRRSGAELACAICAAAGGRVAARDWRVALAAHAGGAPAARGHAGVGPLRRVAERLAAAALAPGCGAAAARRALARHSGPRAWLAATDADGEQVRARAHAVLAAQQVACAAVPALHGRVAWLALDTPCHIERWAAHAWRSRLPCHIVVVSNVGRGAGRVHYAAATALPLRVSDYLRHVGWPHEPAARGSVDAAAWPQRLRQLGLTAAGATPPPRPCTWR